jgi:hypothetical protein
MTGRAALGLIEKLVRRTVPNFPINEASKCSTVRTALADREPAHVGLLPFLRFIEGEADCKVTGLALAFCARPALRLGAFPVLGAIADQMPGAAGGADPLRAAFVPIRLKLERS